MDIFRGQAARPGVAIAAAARLRFEYGVPSLAPERLRRLGERLRSFGLESPEPEQVILIADTVPRGFLASVIPGLEIVGVAAQREADDLIFSQPAVFHIGPTLLDGIAEDEIVIIDGDRGRVYASPDAATLMRYQAPIRRTRRFFIGAAHLPARTASDDRVIAVLATAPDWDAVSSAIESGADGLWVPADNTFLGMEEELQTSSEQAQALTRLGELAAGKPIFLDIPSERLALSVLARAAASAVLHVVLDPIQLEEVATRLSEVETFLEDDDILFGTVRLEAGVSTEDPDLPPTLDGFAGVTVVEDVRSAHMDRMLPIAGLAQHAHKPLTLRLPPGGWEDDLALALSLRVARLVTAADQIADLKDAIRMS